MNNTRANNLIDNKLEGTTGLMFVKELEREGYKVVNYTRDSITIDPGRVATRRKDTLVADIGGSSWITVTIFNSMDPDNDPEYSGSNINDAVKWVNDFYAGRLK